MLWNLLRYHETGRQQQQVINVSVAASFAIAPPPPAAEHCKNRKLDVAEDVGGGVNSDEDQQTTTGCHGFHQVSKLERIPEYFRGTFDWFLGRSRRKAADGGGGGGEGKEALSRRLIKGGACVYSEGQTVFGLAGGGCGSRGASMADLSICDIICWDQFRRLVLMPAGIDHCEWLATHVVSFFHHVNSVYGAVAEFCTNSTCPTMAVGPSSSQLIWHDEKGKKWKYSAPQYIDCAMSFLEKTVSSDHFSTKYGAQFSPAFDELMCRCSRLLFHVLAHCQEVHWERLCSLGLRSQSSALTAHLACFCVQFGLLDEKDEAALGRLALRCRPPPPPPPHSPVTDQCCGEQQEIKLDKVGCDDSGLVEEETERKRRKKTLLPHKSSSWGGRESATCATVVHLRPLAQTC